MSKCQRSAAQEAVIAQYLDNIWMEKGLSRNTLESYGRDLAHFAVWLAPKGVELLAVSSFGPVVLPFESDAPVVEGDEAAVGDGDGVGVEGQIGEDRLGAGEGALGVDHPLGFAQGGQKGRELGVIDQSDMLAEELEGAVVVRGGELLQEHASEQP